MAPFSTRAEASGATGSGPDVEIRRLGKLFEYEILDTVPEAAFDDVVKVAAKLFDTSIAVVSLIDRDRQWFKAKVGLDVNETSRDVAFCHHAIKSDDVFVVEDASKHPLFQSNPLVTGDPNIRFYAGAPLITPEGFRLGTLCVIDENVHKTPDENAKTVLQMLARLVMREMENRKLMSRAQQHARMMGRLAEATIEISQSRSIEEVIQMMLKSALSLLNADAAYMRLDTGELDISQLLKSDDMVVSANEMAAINWDKAAALVAERRTLKPVTTDLVRGGHGSASNTASLPKGAWVGFALGSDAENPIGTLQVWRRLTSTYTEFEIVILSDLSRVASAVIERLAARA